MGIGSIASGIGEAMNNKMVSFTDGDILSFSVASAFGKLGSANTAGGVGFVFKLSTIPLSSITREREYRWAKIDRVDREPLKQWMGQGDETITLAGIVYPFYNQSSGLVRFLTGDLGDAQIKNVDKMAQNGTPFLVINGRGTVLGRFIIDKVRETNTYLTTNGTARKQEIEISLSKYGEISDSQREQLYQKSFYKQALRNQAIKIVARRVATYARRFNLPTIKGL